MTYQKEHTEQLFTLIKENPTLRIVPMVLSEIVASDDHGWWMGSFGKSSIEEIYLADERIYIRSEDEDELIENEIEDLDAQIDLPDDVAREKAKEFVDRYEWEKVIAVKIGLP